MFICSPYTELSDSKHHVTLQLYTKRHGFITGGNIQDSQLTEGKPSLMLSPL
jgi:hypothetical protein